MRLHTFTLLVVSLTCLAWPVEGASGRGRWGSVAPSAAGREARILDVRQSLRLLCPGHLDLAAHFERAARRYGLPAELLVSVARQESRCDSTARGARGERGIMQLLPGTRAAGRVPVDRLDRPAVNVRLGAAHLARCLLLCGDLAGALGVYSGRRTCPAGRASPYAGRVLRLFEEAGGLRS